MALDQGEVTLLIPVIQFRTAFGIKSLGGTGQSGTCNRFCDVDVGISILKLEVYKVFLQYIRTPLAIKLHIFLDGHIGKVEGLFHITIFIKPTDKFIFTIDRNCRNRFQLLSMVNLRIRMSAEFFIRSQGIQIKIEGNCIWPRRDPFGVQRQRSISVVCSGRHSVGSKVKFIAGTFRVQIPAFKCHRTGFVLCRGIRCSRRPVVTAQWRLIRDIFRLTQERSRIIKLNRIIMTVIVELCAIVATACVRTQRIIKGIALNIYKLFRRNSQVAAILNINCIQDLIVCRITSFRSDFLNQICCRLHIIRICCFCIICTILSRHNIHKGSPRATTITIHRPKVCISRGNYSKVLSNIRTPFVRNGVQGIAIASSFLKGHGESGTVIVNIHNRRTVCRNDHVLRTNKCPQAAVQTTSGSVTGVIMGMLLFTAGITGDCVLMILASIAIRSMGVVTYIFNFCIITATAPISAGCTVPLTIEIQVVM